MKTSDLLLLGAVGFGAWYLLRKTHAISTLVFFPRGVGFSNGAMQITVGVQNPTNTPLTLKSIAGTVFLNGDAVGNISSFMTQVIQPNQETPIQLNVAPNVFGLALFAGGTLAHGLDDVSFSVTGYANVDQNTFPLNFNFAPSI